MKNRKEIQNQIKHVEGFKSALEGVLDNREFIRGMMEKVKSQK
jgi:hypothetical protein